jgi:hypothetical protein
MFNSSGSVVIAMNSKNKGDILSAVMLFQVLQKFHKESLTLLHAI